jgi:hypothetical protein
MKTEECWRLQSRIAHAQGLVVDSFDVRADGSIHIELRDYEVARDGTVRVHEDAA